MIQPVLFFGESEKKDPIFCCFSRWTFLALNVSKPRFTKSIKTIIRGYGSEWKSLKGFKSLIRKLNCSSRLFAFIAAVLLRKLNGSQREKDDSDKKKLLHKTRTQKSSFETTRPRTFKQLVERRKETF